jgi:hypothetical protein
MSTAAHLLRLWVRIPLEAWTFVCCECCVLSGRGLCEELITRSEETYRLWRVIVCDLETSKEEAKSPLKGCQYKPTMGCDAERKKKVQSDNGCNGEWNMQLLIIYDNVHLTIVHLFVYYINWNISLMHEYGTYKIYSYPAGKISSLCILMIVATATETCTYW